MEVTITDNSQGIVENSFPGTAIKRLSEQHDGTWMLELNDGRAFVLRGLTTYDGYESVYLEDSPQKA